MKSFSKLPLSEPMLKNLTDIDYKIMTPVQELCIPAILEGKDILAQAKTGSGKTAAFGIGMLHRLKVERFRVQALILCPTRELADQVSAELRKIARFRHNIKLLTITGGMPMYKQELSLSHQAHIVVGTPGRVGKLLKKGSLNLKELQMLVLDEADRMLDMGFSDQVDAIMEYVPTRRQTLCFSATFPDEIRKLSHEYLNKPEEITVETHHDETVITQHVYEAKNRDKIKTILSLLAGHNPESTLIFCNTKDVCRRVSAELNKAGLQTLALHGDLEQRDRTEVLVRFSNGSSRVLVATDVAARGLDIDFLACVINYDMPFETETYVHRIGRTGRAGREGLALSLMVPGEDFRLNKVNELQNTELKAVDPFEIITEDIPSLEAEWLTLSINGGRKNKVSPGDILGALTSNNGIPGSEVGKIDRMDFLTFVAVKRSYANQALKVLEAGKIKGRTFKVLLHE